MNPFPILLVLILSFLLFSQVDAQIQLSAKSSSSNSGSSQITSVPKGPWGELEYFTLFLEPSDYYISLSRDLSSWQGGTVWKFDSPGVESLSTTLRSAGLDAGTISALIQPDTLFHNEGTGLFEIRPSEEIILRLTQEQRASLYKLLLPKSPSNPFAHPFSLPPGGIRSVIHGDCGVTEENLNLIEKLSFRKEMAYRFSDIALLLGKASGDTERKRILKILSREASLSLRLRLSEEGNLNELAEYWSAGGKNKDILPLLHSVVTTSGVDRLDIAHLLPPTPRKLLHTFPSPSGYGIAEDLPDCFWTAYSFFSEAPPERHLDFVGHVFSERYESATPPLQLGDLITISDPETGDWFHACNYVAADLVFTKNGRSMGRPWVISTLQKVVAGYHTVNEVQVSFHRLKPEYHR